MYNRYVPQPDGSYRRNRMQEAQRPAPPPVQQSAQPYTDPQPPSEPSRNERPAPRRREPSAPVSARSFLRKLLPGNLDTEDLLVVVLLLLMAGDCEDDRNSALLTLALYLFL